DRGARRGPPPCTRARTPGCAPFPPGRAARRRRGCRSYARVEVLQGIDAGLFRIDRFDDRARMFAAAVELPRVGEERVFEERAFVVGDDLHLRPERVRRMFGGYHRELFG